MASGAVNPGNVYRKATDHVPYDMRMANTGVNQDAIVVLGSLVMIKLASFRLCGRKRSRPWKWETWHPKHSGGRGVAA
jgi:hypothetical protein